MQKKSKTDLKHDRQCMCYVTSWRVRVTIFAVEKQISITYSECVFVALCIQHAMRVRRVILSSMACPALKYFVLHCLKNSIIFGNMYSIQNVF